MRILSMESSRLSLPTPVSFASSSNTFYHTVTLRPPSSVTAIKTATTKEKTTTYSANITWTGNVLNPADFLVRRYTNGGTGCTLDPTFATVNLQDGKTSYTDSKATADTCAYAVAATKASVASAFVLSNRLE